MSTKLNRCLETGESFDRKLLSIEDKTNVYISEFIYSKYEGISDYSKKIKVFMNSIIELDVNIQFENIKDIRERNNNVIMVAEYVVKDLYSIYDQLLEINKELHCESIIGRRR